MDLSHGRCPGSYAFALVYVLARFHRKCLCVVIISDGEKRRKTCIDCVVDGAKGLSRAIITWKVLVSKDLRLKEGRFYDFSNMR